MSATTSRRRRACLSFALLVVVAGAVATLSHATPRGKNGAVAFTRYTDASRSAGAIFTVHADGRMERRVTKPPPGTVDQHPDWSRDGARIVFERCSVTCRIATVAANGSDLRVLTHGCSVPGTRACATVRGPAFSPDGRRIAVGLAWGEVMLRPPSPPCPACGRDQIEHFDLVVVNADGRNVRKVMGIDGWRGDLNRAQFSPDGKRLVVERTNSWRSKPKGGSALFVVSVNGTGLRRITPWELAAGDGPDWSPDGRRILFRSPRSAFRGSNLYTVRPDGTGLRQVTRFRASVEVLSASYAPDGTRIVFSRTGRGGLPDLFVVRPDGTGLRQVTRTLAWDSAPDWGPR